MYALLKRRTLLASAISAIFFSSLVGCSQKNEEASTTNASSATSESSSSVAWPKITSKIAQDPAVEKRIDDLMSRMTLEEKVGQVVQPELRHVTPQDVKEFHLGSILNGGGSTPGGDKYASLEDWVKLADSFYLASVDKSNGRLGIPLIWGTDAVHGLGNVVGATLFPHNIALGATHNPDLLEEIGRVTAREIAVTGLDWNFSPTVAVARDDRWGRAYEAWSEDPEIVGKFAGRNVEGLQGRPQTDELFTDTRVIATAKHYIGDGGTLNGIDRGETQGDETVLRDIHGAGYFSALESGVQVVMASFTSWQGDRMHGHKYLLTDVLKDQMGFDGLVVGDWSGHSFIPGCTALNCPQSLMAGLDIYMVPEPDWKELYKNLVEQAKTGELPMARLDDAVRRILRVKIRYGIFERGAPSTRSLAADKTVFGSPEHRAVARQAVRESLVLLKNKNNLLPLSPKLNVLVAGDGADNIGKQSGGWSVTWQGTGNANSDFPVATSIWAGIEQSVKAAGGKAELSDDGSFKQKPDVAIVVWGEDPYAEMQGDIPHLAYKPRNATDWELLKKLKAQGIPVVSLFITGRPMWVNREINASDAFVSIWQPGTEGNGVADVIFTDANGKVAHDMKGRLTFSWPKRPDQSPLNRADANYDPLFAYGYGLSYGDKDTLGDDLSEESGFKVEAALDVLELFNRRPFDPFYLEITGFQNDHILMNSSTIKASSVTLAAVDRDVQEDARRAVWNGAGAGQVAVAVENRQDWTNYWKEDSALVFDVKVNQAPSAPTFLRLGCGSYCASDIDFTQTLKTAGNEWVTYTVGFNCFPEAGANFGVTQPAQEYWTQVLKPFSLYTTGTLDLTFANVKVIKGGGKGAACPK